jgi:hypothetical protein
MVMDLLDCEEAQVSYWGLHAIAAASCSPQNVGGDWTPVAFAATPAPVAPPSPELSTTSTMAASIAYNKQQIDQENALKIAMQPASTKRRMPSSFKTPPSSGEANKRPR